ncbi:hypothetical protein FA10DRAFT_262797 [Acaromyces ingoldii]|uniref:Uncharacterized protein n=1 Tax=Acaromyces ingoldii TaxID=215250 RepID=A0A316YB28_9BASI|nr:hypothetical protein FA10DRAFT_262797 [Acaromyces ingoldii]PWN87010.1 hypothetical protein FA10DRAFT_262797 [Acaromyces ingoldii]
MARSSILRLGFCVILFLLIPLPSTAVEGNHLERRARKKSIPKSTAAFGVQQPQLSQQKDEEGVGSASHTIAMQRGFDEQHNTINEDPSAIVSPPLSYHANPSSSLERHVSSLRLLPPSNSPIGPATSSHSPSKSQHNDLSGSPPQVSAAARRKKRFRRPSEKAKENDEAGDYTSHMTRQRHSSRTVFGRDNKTPSEESIQELFDEVAARSHQTDGKRTLSSEEKKHLSIEALHAFNIISKSSRVDFQGER